MSNDVPHNRRHCDSCAGHETPCEGLTKQEAVYAQILAKLDAMEATQKSMQEMLTAWNNTKGFVSTVKNAGVLLLWIAALAAAWATVTELFKHWVAMK